MSSHPSIKKIKRASGRAQQTTITREIRRNVSAQQHNLKKTTRGEKQQPRKSRGLTSKLPKRPKHRSDAKIKRID